MIPIVLASCGGTGAQGQGGAAGAAPAGLGGTGGQAQIQLTSDKAVLDSNRTTPVQLTAVVVDGNGVSVPNRPITWQVVDSVAPAGVRLDGTTTKTDNTGKAIATLVLSGDQSNRAVQVTATSSEITTTLPITIAGTSIVISGPQTVPLNGAASRFTVNLKDSSGLGIGGKSLTVASQAGNQISGGNAVVTDVSGKANVDMIGTISGADTLVVSGLGATGAFAISVATEALQVTPALADIPIGPTGSTVTVSYSKAGGIPAGTIVSLTSTRGTVTPASANISSGSATFQISSSTAGPVTLSATIGSTQGIGTAQFIATTPAAIDLQATPTIIGPNQAGQSTERSQLIATVRDVSGNPVKGKIVAFTNPVDPSGGSIDPPTAITDDAGQATSTFIAGGQATSPNGVALQAEVVGSTVTPAQALLSVSRSQLFVRIGNGGTIEVPTSPPVYHAKYAVIVTDSTGNPVKNAPVQLRITPKRYYVGGYCIFDNTTGICDAAKGGVWRRPTFAAVSAPIPDGTWFGYPSEDVNNDGVCQAGEDVGPGPANPGGGTYINDRHLTPGNVASVNSTVTTDEFGAGEVVVTYPRQFGTWVDFILEATIRVGGSEGSTALYDNLPVPAQELGNIAVTPAWRYSPFPYAVDRPTCP